MAETQRPAPRLSTADRARIKREEKLAELQEDIETGRLVVRQMTDEEKAQFDRNRGERPGRFKRGRSR